LPTSFLGASGAFYDTVGFAFSGSIPFSCRLARTTTAKYREALQDPHVEPAHGVGLIESAERVLSGEREQETRP